MTKEEVIKELRYLYTCGVCCIKRPQTEALAMAIATLQEEPESIWHDASEKPIKGKIILVVQDNGFPFVCDVRNDIGYVSLSFDHSNKTKIDGKDKWAYIEDLLKLSNIHKTIKNWKEPVSEDLGDYINELSKQFPEVSFAKLSMIAVKVAKWQEQQDQETIELAEDHAMLAGMEKMKEQIMKDAVSAKITEVYYPTDSCLEVEVTLPKNRFEDGDKVLIIKEK